MADSGVVSIDADAFVLDPDVAFLNHGSFGACPREVIEARQAYQHQLERQPVRFLQRELPDLLDAARAELAGFLGIGEGGPPTPAAKGLQARLEWLARTLQNLPVRWPELWETVLRDHYIRGLRRGWQQRTQQEQTPSG